jgi:hypothetical protein
MPRITQANSVPDSRGKRPMLTAVTNVPRPNRRVSNWDEYREALRHRGSLTVWLTDEAIAAWTR